MSDALPPVPAVSEFRNNRHLIVYAFSEPDASFMQWLMMFFPRKGLVAGQVFRGNLDAVRDEWKNRHAKKARVEVRQWGSYT